MTDALHDLKDIDIPADTAHDLMHADNPPAVIDVRTPEEFGARHIPRPPNIVLDDIRAGKIAPEMDDKNALYLLYCRSGRRSGIAARWLSERGWKHVHNFGGILDWPYETT